MAQSLQTASPKKVKVRANIAAAKLYAYWSQMRLAKSEVIDISLVWDVSSHIAVVDLSSSHADCPSFLNALQYILIKSKSRPKTLRLAAERSCNYELSMHISNNLGLLFGAILSFN